MSETPAERLSKTLQAKQREREASEQKKKVDAKERERNRQALARQITAALTPVFSQARSVFEERGYAATFADELLDPTPRKSGIWLVVRHPDTSSSSTALRVWIDAGRAAFAFYSGDSMTRDNGTPVEELSEAWAWARVEELAGRLP